MSLVDQSLWNKELEKISRKSILVVCLTALLQKITQIRRLSNTRKFFISLIFITNMPNILFLKNFF
jgi:hypothetical protein